MSNTMFQSPARRQTLDAMRGVAALLVAVFHFEQHLPGYQMSGYLAVDLFFALSGYVIADNYEKRLSSGLGFWKFFEIRLIRLYPLYLLGLGVGIGKQIIGITIHDPRALQPIQLITAATLNLIMLPAPANVALFPLNGPSWSLFFEVVVNILFAVIIWRARAWQIAIISAFAATYLISQIGTIEYFNTGWAWSTADLGLARALYSFCAGMIISRYTRNSVRRVSWWGLVPVIMMIAAITVPLGVSRRSVELGIVLALFPALLLIAVLIDLPSKARPLSAMLGDISYPIYAIHWPLVPLIVAVLNKITRQLQIVEAGFVLILIVLGYICSRYIDAPIRRLLSHRAHLRQSAQIQSRISNL